MRCWGRELRSGAGWVLAMAALAAGLRAAGDEARPVVAGYFPSWGIYERNYLVTNMPADMLTHVLYAFAQPVYDPDLDTAALVSFDAYADTDKMFPGDIEGQPLKGNFNQLAKLKQRYPHLRTLISAGGWTLSDAFSDIAASSNARLAFAASCVSFMTNYGFDGIDVDWEFPVEGGASGVPHRPEDAENFVLLLQALRQRLDAQAQVDGRTYLLTIAADGDPRHLATRYRIAETAATVDWINVMTYNFAAPSDRRTGHNSPLYANPAQPYLELNCDSSVREYLTNGVPHDKIALGIPYYGHGYRDVAATNNGLFQFHGGASIEGSWEAGVFDYRDLRDGASGHPYIQGGGFTNFWDGLSMTPYLFNPTSHVFISYDDERSIGRKAGYVRDHGLRGVMMWSLDSDTADQALTRSLYLVLYPFRVSYAGGAVQPGGMSLSWQGWTGQVYRVWTTTRLADDDWEDCSTLVDAQGSPVASLAGFNARLHVTDTNSAAEPYRFYRVVATNAW